jgi:hypothetical protein
MPTHSEAIQAVLDALVDKKNVVFLVDGFNSAAAEISERTAVIAVHLEHNRRAVYFVIVSCVKLQAVTGFDGYLLAGDINKLVDHIVDLRQEGSVFGLIKSRFWIIRAKCLALERDVVAYICSHKRNQ